MTIRIGTPMICAPTAKPKLVGAAQMITQIL